jgi:hypothetical protein
MHSLCPECDERLNPAARQCVCGWKNPAYFKGKDKAPHDPDGWRCGWTNGNKQCRYPGSINSGLRGDGRYLCGFHFRGGDASEAARITDESYGWDGKPESYLAMRFAEQKSARANAGSEGGEKQAAPGVSRKLRNDAGGDAAIPIVHAAMAGLGDEVEPGYAAGW